MICYSTCIMSGVNITYHHFNDLCKYCWQYHTHNMPLFVSFFATLDAHVAIPDRHAVCHDLVALAVEAVPAPTFLTRVTTSATHVIPTRLTWNYVMVTVAAVAPFFHVMLD